MAVVMRQGRSVFNLPVAQEFDPARWAEAAFDVWQASGLSAHEIDRTAARRVQVLVSYARTASPFYARRYRKAPEHPALADLQPVTKADLMDHFDEVVTHAEVTRSSVETFIARPDRIGRSLAGRYSVWTSSGTTGLPGLFVHDPDALAVYDALEAQRFRGLRSPTDLLRQLIEGDRYAMVAATDGHFAGVATVERMRHWAPWMASAVRAFALLQPCGALVDQLNAYKPTILATYPTAAEMLAEEQEAGRLQVRPREIWTGGEVLSEPTRLRVQRAFGCRVRSAYGASEFLPIAWECPHRHLHVNADWVVLEPVDRLGNPVPPGTRSHSVLLTNLANRIQPLIRYDLGDAVTVASEPCACGSYFPVIAVEGRCDDTLRLPGRRGGEVMVVPLALETVLEESAGAHEFQVVQRRDGTLAVHLGAQERERRGQVRAALQSYFETCEVGPVDILLSRRAPERDAASGKLRRVVCQLPR
ncbi:MAG TPA: AMP-binding protein [Burkholderiaceae bacterium]|nr:AMP-binding protein [Burkholderiaceae bacterium]